MKLLRISACILLAACTAITSFATCTSTWQAVPSPSPAHQSGDANQLSGVAALSATDAWAVGWSLSFSGGGYQTLAEHWDGNQWNVVPTANTSMRNNYLRAVSVVEADDVWAVGQQDNGSGLPFTLVEHWDGHSWTVDSTGTMQGSLGAVIAFSPNDVWAGGFVLEHFDGTSWKVQSVGAANYLGSFAGTTNNLWAVGYRTIQPIGPVLTFTAHRNAGAWARYRAVDPLNVSKDDEDVLVGVDMAPGDRHPFAVGCYADFDGGPPAQTLIEQWDGTKWVQMNSPNPGGTTMDNELWDVAVLSRNDAWAVGTVGSDGSSDNQTMILHWDGSQWTATPNTGIGVLINVAGDKASGTLWAVGYAAASNYQGTLILSACGL